MRFRKSLRALLYLGPLILWMGIVVAGSTYLGRYEESLTLIQRTAYWLSPDAVSAVDVNNLYQINNAARKLVHVAAFAVFTMLSVRAIQWGEAKLKWQSLAGSLVLCIVFALSEASVRFQSPIRHVRLEQFVLNGIGAVLTFGLTMLYFRIKHWEKFLWEGKAEEGSETA